jgi:FkbM family methyltransferase
MAGSKACSEWAQAAKGINAKSEQPCDLASARGVNHTGGRMNSYSQFGEDLLLWKYFGERRQGFFLEAGANHPTLRSQTWLFEQNGWTGILVEPLAANCALLRRERPHSRVFQLALGSPEQCGRARFSVAAGSDAYSGLVLQDGVAQERTEEVEIRTLDQVLAEAANPKLDFVSLDVEGAELDVLNGFDLPRHQPGVLLVEDHLQRLGLHRWIVGRGYRLVKRTGCNSWYVPGGAPFSLNTAGERFQLWKEIQIDTPVRIARFFFKRRSARRRQTPIASSS